MPSKGKKNSKTQSRLSNSDTFTSSGSIHFEPNEVGFVSALEQASTKYPSLIGKTAFIGQVTDVDDTSKDCKVWLSEPSMVANSFTPGSIVSVSMPCLGSRFSERFPLSSLADECATRFRVESCKELSNEPGNYFALATIFPSAKVSKNGVRLSSNLSNTMGCPASGRTIFIHSVQNKVRAGVLSDTEKPPSTDCLLVSDCKELNLELLHSNSRLTTNNTATRFSADKSLYWPENGMLESPNTPLNQSKLSFSNSSPLASPQHEDSASSLVTPDESFIEPFDVEEVLGDDTSKKLLQTCATTWLYSRCLLYGNLLTIPVLSQHCLFQVIGAKKLSDDKDNYDLLQVSSELVEKVNGAYLVKRETKVCFHLPSKLVKGRDISTGQCKDAMANTGDDTSRLGGLSKEYAVLKDIIISSSMDTLSRLGLRPTKGVLLHGPPGTGKTSLARLCARDAGVNFFSVNGPEVVSQYYGKSEQALREIFDSASEAAPSVIFIDELDAIAPARKEGGEELSLRMVATLLNLMDGISTTERVLVIAATNKPDSIEPALRRPGRLDREIEIGVPSPKQRLEILHVLVGEMEHCLSDVQVEQLANATHGFVGSDLAALCNEAAFSSLRRYVSSRYPHDYLHRTSSTIEDCSNSLVVSDCLEDTMDMSKEYSDTASSSFTHLTFPSEDRSSLHLKGANQVDNIEEELKVAFEDFESARIKVRPSAMREVIVEVPKVNWEDVGGQTEVKNQLIEAVMWPQKHQDEFKRIGISPPTGVLMFGPPGCSKTLMARAVASEARLNFLSVKGPELYSKWVGESEKAVRSVFAKARANSPAIIFFDEIDGLAAIRGKENDGVSVSDRVISQLLVEMDGLQERVDVTVIAATNRPDKIDSALLRPDETDREEIFRIHLKNMECGEINTSDLARQAEGYTGADIRLVCREAGLAAIEEGLCHNESLDALEIKMQHLETAIRQVKPTETQFYQELSGKFQRLVISNINPGNSS